MKISGTESADSSLNIHVLISLKNEIVEIVSRPAKDFVLPIRPGLSPRVSVVRKRLGIFELTPIWDVSLLQAH